MPAGNVFIDYQCGFIPDDYLMIWDIAHTKLFEVVTNSPVGVRGAF